MRVSGRTAAERWDSPPVDGRTERVPPLYVLPVDGRRAGVPLPLYTLPPDGVAIRVDPEERVDMLLPDGRLERELPLLYELLPEERVDMLPPDGRLERELPLNDPLLRLEEWLLYEDPLLRELE